MLDVLSRFRISTKLVTPALGGIFFVAVMIASQVAGNASVERGLGSALDQQEIARLAIAAKSEARQMQVAVRDLRLAKTEADIRAAEERLAAGRRAADQLCIEMNRRPVSVDGRARIESLQQSIDAYAAGAKRIAAVRHRIAPTTSRRAGLPRSRHWTWRRPTSRAT